MHAEAEYSGMWLSLFEDLTQYGEDQHQLRVSGDGGGSVCHEPEPHSQVSTTRKLNDSETLYLFGAGREKKIYAIPPHTQVVSMCFEDVPFRTEDFEGKHCRLCGAVQGCIWMKFSMRRPERKYTNAMIPDSARKDECASKNSSADIKYAEESRLRWKCRCFASIGLTVRYGKTCGYCRNGGQLNKNTCPHCKTVWACQRCQCFSLRGRNSGNRGRVRFRKIHIDEKPLF